MRFTPLSDDAALKAILDPSRFVRWIYTARLSLATAIFLAAIFAWRDAAVSNTLKIAPAVHRFCIDAESVHAECDLGQPGAVGGHPREP